MKRFLQILGLLLSLSLTTLVPAQQPESAGSNQDLSDGFPLGTRALADSILSYLKGFPPPSALQFSSENQPGSLTLMDDGSLIFQFKDNALVDGPGDDLRIIGNWAEVGTLKAWISQNGVQFKYLGVVRPSGYIDVKGMVTPAIHYHYIKIRLSLKPDAQQCGYIKQAGIINGPGLMVLPSQYLLAPRSTQWTATADNVFPRLKRFLLKHPISRLIIEVYSDNRGEESYLLTLTQMQADVVKTELLKRMELRPDQITAIGMGGRSPLADNSTAQGRLANQRIKFIIHP